jgi:PAS domain S-box-containing protein
LSGASRRSVVFLLFLLAALVLAAFCIHRYFGEIARIRSEKHATLEAIADLKVAEIVKWRRECLADLRVLIRGPLFRRADAALRRGRLPEPLRQDLHERFDRVREHYDYVDILLVDARGRVLISSLSSKDATLFPTELAALEEAMRSRSEVIGEFYRCGNCDEVHIDIVGPIVFDDAASVAAVVMRTVPKDNLYPLIQSWPTPSKSAETLLFRQDGDDILYLNELRHHPGSALSLRLPLSRFNQLAARAVAAAQGTFSDLDYRGVLVLAVHRPVPGSTWQMVAKVDEAELLADVNRNARIVGIFVALFTVLAVAITAVLYRDRQVGLYRRLLASEREQHAADELLRITLYSIGDGVIATDTTGAVTHMNAVAEFLTGWREAEARGRPVEEVFAIRNEETRAEVANPVSRALNEGVVVGLANHTLLIARDGAERLISNSAAPIRDPDGRIIGVVMIFRDTTRERRPRAALQANEELFRNLFASLPVGVALIDPDLRYGQVNRRLTEILGRPESENRGRHFGEFTHDDDRKTGLLEMERILAGDFPTVTFEKRFLKSNGSIVHANLTLTRLLLSRSAAVIAIVEDISVRRSAEEKARGSERRYRLLFDNMPAGFALHAMIYDAVAKPVDYRFLEVNPAFEKLTGLRRENLLGRTVKEVLPGTEQHWIDAFGEVARTGIPATFENISRELGKIFEVRAFSPAPDRFAVIFTDVSDRKRLEEEKEKLTRQFHQSQKMEAVGRLAGGVAHDFNNMLQAIQGHTELALSSIEPRNPVHEDLEEIRSAAVRAADLTGQLLAFARRQTVRPRTLDLNETIGAMLKMLRRLIGEEIELAWRPAENLRPVCVDPTQIDQILVNLFVNARDAIAGVGKVTVETANVTIDRAYCDHHVEAASGDYVMVAVSDSGGGMDREVLERIFEPFFTTKAPGKGTGLGLATVHGIVRQNNGFINVYSEPGQGTTFKIHLPVSESLAIESGAPAVYEPPRTGTETILLVEDEPAILKVAMRVLKRHGYTVLTAGTPQAAIEIAAKHDATIDLLITDVVLPEMNGKEVKAAIEVEKPGIRTLFMSGYTANVIAHHGVLDPDVNFLQKPFSIKALLEAVRKVLDANSAH